MTATTPSVPGAFVQLIEYRTDRPEEMAAIVSRWTDAIGAERTARWYVTAADRDQPDRFVQLVEFPSFEAAMENSSHPATSDFARELKALAGDSVVFHNLDVTAAATV
jgi:hypothetical protein